MEPADEELHVFYLLDIANNARAPVNPATPFAFDMPDGAERRVMHGRRRSPAQRQWQVAVRGPFPPGQRSSRWRARCRGQRRRVDVAQTFPATDRAAGGGREEGRRDDAHLAAAHESARDVGRGRSLHRSRRGRRSAAGTTLTLTSRACRTTAAPRARSRSCWQRASWPSGSGRPHARRGRAATPLRQRQLGIGARSCSPSWCASSSDAADGRGRRRRDTPSAAPALVAQLERDLPRLGRRKGGQGLAA